MLEDGLGEIEMLLRRVAPTAVIVGKCVVWWAKIGGRDQNRARETPLWVIDTPDLKASAAAQPIVEQGCAQSCCVCPVPLAV